MRNSGKIWSQILNIPIADPTGWASVQDYEDRLITKEEFCNRAANSVVKLDKPLTRRAASDAMAKYKQQIHEAYEQKKKDAAQKATATKNKSPAN